MKRNICILEKNKCTGCEACASACNFFAIDMKPNREGFYYPEVDDTKCVECGACERVCAALNPIPKTENAPLCYAVMADDENRITSASGGAFAIAAEYILSRGGYVCGAAFNEDFSVQHIIINKKSELISLKQSKYLQSRMKNVYREIKDILVKEDKEVLFCGCPCQVAGLKKFLNKEYEKLYTIDLICHGVPSHKILSRYLDEKTDNDNIESISFRDKSHFGWLTSMTINYKDKPPYTVAAREKKDPYYLGFLNFIFLRKSCGECQFANLSRNGEMTIGDFWGISKFDEESFDRKGTSLVLVNNEKGRDFFEKLKTQAAFKYSKEASLEWCRNNAQLWKSAVHHKSRESFFDYMEKDVPFSKAVNLCLGTHRDVGLVGVWYNPNYGSFLTNYALRNTIKDMGYSVLMIERPVDDLKSYKKIDNHSRRAAEKYYKGDISPVYSFKQLELLNGLCDKFVVGSDQLWNYNVCSNAEYYYFLNFADNSKTKIAYATSFGGNTFPAEEEYRQNAQEYLQRFDRISVRENDAVGLCREKFNVYAEWCLDPVFMCDKKHYEAILKDSKLSIENDYILSYILDPTNDKRSVVIQTAKFYDKERYVILDGKGSKAESNMKKMNLKNTKFGVEIADWLYYFKNSSAVVTDSFHGTCFAIIFRKNFICLTSEKRGLSRMTSLLGMLGLKDRLISDHKLPALKPEMLMQPIDYDRVYKIIEEKRDTSLRWLRKALAIDNTYKYMAERELNEKSGEFKASIEEFQKRLDAFKENLEE